MVVDSGAMSGDAAGRARKLGLALALLAACSGEAPSFVPLPPLPSSAQSWVFAATQGAARDAEALQLTALPGQGQLVRLVSAQRALRLHAWAYAATLEELGVEAGPLGAAEPCQRSCGLLQPQRMFTLDFARGRPGEWTEVSALEPGILSALVPDAEARCQQGCLSYTVATAPLEPRQVTAFLVQETLSASEPTTAESALLGLVNGALYRVQGPGQLAKICGPGSGFAPTAAVDRRRHRLWTSRGDGVGYIELDQLDPDLPCPFTRTATLSDVLRLSLTPDREPPELLSLSSTGAVVRVQGAKTKPLGLMTAQDNQVYAGFVLSLGSVGYVGAGINELGVIEGDRLSFLRDFSLGARPAMAESVLYHQGDVYFGFRTYNLFVQRQAQGMISPLDEGPVRMNTTWDDPENLAVLDGRIVALLNNGLVGEWSARTGYCPLQGRFTPLSSRYMVNVQGTLVVPDGDALDAPEWLVRWLIPRRPVRCAPKH